MARVLRVEPAYAQPLAEPYPNFGESVAKWRGLPRTPENVAGHWRALQKAILALQRRELHQYPKRNEAAVRRLYENAMADKHGADLAFEYQRGRVHVVTQRGLDFMLANGAPPVLRVGLYITERRPMSVRERAVAAGLYVKDHMGDENV